MAARGSQDNSFGNGSMRIVTPLTSVATLGSRGNGFTPYTISFTTGQDISRMFTSFSYLAPVCILSANGIVSHVVLHRAATSGGTVLYEGRFEILMLSGELSDSNSLYNETGGLNVLLAGSNNRVFGGRLAGILISASPVQVIVASFTSGAGQQSLMGSRNRS